VLAGASSTSTFEAAERAKMAELAGADGLLVTPAFYLKYTPEGLIKHFQTIAESTNLPIVLYNSPDFLGFDLPTSDLVRITDRIENVVAIKDSTTDMLEFSNRLRLFEREGRVRILLGNEPYCYHGLSVGSAGIFNSVGNFATGLMKKMCESFWNGKTMEARSIYLALTEYFAFRRKTKNPIGVVKEAMVQSGIDIEPFVRPPLTNISQEEKAELEAILEKLRPRITS
jgi:dihydrodipicolinate synthase/N-acetylneuraminate lyase